MTEAQKAVQKLMDEIVARDPRLKEARRAIEERSKQRDIKSDFNDLRETFHRLVDHNQALAEVNKHLREQATDRLAFLVKLMVELSYDPQASKYVEQIRQYILEIKT